MAVPHQPPDDIAAAASDPLIRAAFRERFQKLMESATGSSTRIVRAGLWLLVVAAGLPRPEVQWVVQDVATRTAFWLDLAWPERRIGIEYEG